MNIRHVMLSAAALFSAGALFGAGELSADAKDMVKRTDLSRQAVVHRGDFLVREGHRLFEERNFQGAISKYNEAIQLFQRYPSRFFQDKVDFCKKEISACYFAIANEVAARSDKMALAEDFEEAIRVCREAQAQCPEQADELQRRIVLFEKRRDSLVQRSAFSTERLIPDKEAQEYQIQVLLEQARRLAAVKDYSSALVKYNEVLLIDPYNADATQGRRGISRRMSGMGKQRYVNTHRRVMAEVEWKYALPVIQEASGNPSNVVSSAVAKPESLRSSFIQPKLERINVNLDINNKRISAAVNYLQAESRRNDTDPNPLTKGVNIIYIGDVRNSDESAEDARKRAEARQKRQEERRKRLEASRKNAADADNDEEQPAVAETEDQGDPDEPRVTLSGGKRSLLQALIMLCQSAKPKLNMQVDDYAVVLTPADVTLSNMMLRSYPVTIPAGWEGESPEEISKKIQDDLQVKADGMNLFPNGSVLYYNADTKRVSVNNTRDNHREIQKLLEERFKPKDTTMVQVMVKLVDINQNDLDELAFNWQLAVNSNKARVNAKGNPTRSMIMEPNNPLLRYYNNAGERVFGDVNGSLLSWVWQNEKGTRVVASMFAMNQADSSDVLMSPRITVKEGIEGSISMIEVHHFPEDWEDIDFSQTSNIRLNPTSQPQIEDETELGVDFKVKPVVNGNLITAEINVNFKTLAGWSEYDTRTFDEEGNVEDGEYYRMAILNNPGIHTMVTARDGETIIAGGVVADETSSVNDKIPILGDIPFIGRLFKSKGSKSSKRNLLVFVTFRLVKPDGTPVDARYKRDGLHPQGYPRFGSGL